MKILIVDGSALCRELLAKTLEASGFAVSCVNSSTSAGEAVAAVKPELVIIDPATDGGCMRFLEGVRQRQAVRVIVLTDLTDKQTVVRAAQLGVRDYMLKQRFSLSGAADSGAEECAGGGAGLRLGRAGQHDNCDSHDGSDRSPASSGSAATGGESCCGCAEAREGGEAAFAGADDGAGRVWHGSQDAAGRSDGGDGAGEFAAGRYLGCGAGAEA